jgi:hypothetical protein
MVWRARRGRERRTAYWITRSDKGEFHAYRGPVDEPPAQRGEPAYVIRHDRVYRAFGHPDGPSSVPYLEIRQHKVYPGEGYPGGRSGHPLYEVIRWRRPDGPGVVIRRTEPGG